MKHREVPIIGVTGAVLFLLGSGAACSPGFSPGDPWPLFLGSLPNSGLVVNAADGQGNPIHGADIIATDGQYTTWLLDIVYAGQYRGVYKAGTYRVTINAAGYEEYSVEGVVVTSNEVDGSVEPNRVDLDVVLEATE